MLKRIITIALVCFIALSAFSGCGKKTGEIKKEGEGDLTEKSIAYATEMASGSFDNTAEAFDSTMKSMLTAEQLSQVWSDTVKNIGACKSVYSSEYKAVGDGHQVTVILEYELSGLTVLFAYDSSGSISGLWINYFNIPDQTASTDNINVKIGEEPYVLDGILRMPPQAGDNPPVVIMVQGSGPSDYDETVGLNKPFKDLAEGLALRGIASLRVNKRFYQYPEAASSGISIEDEVISDINHAINFVINHSELKNSNIYILGHSLGGMLAPYIASINPDVDGLIIMAGSPRGLEDIILDQNIAALEAMTDLPEAEKERLLAEVGAQTDKIKSLTEKDAGTIVLGVPAEYWLSLNRINTSEICKKLDIPMLIMQGSADFQVSPDKDYKMWTELLSDNTNVSFKLYDGLNHLFMPTSGKTDVSEYETRSEVDGQVISDIAEWIIG